MSEQNAAIAPDARPRLPHGVRLAHSEAHGGWVLLAPERVFKADAIAVEILKRCTGAATIDDIVDDLAKTFNAPRERIDRKSTRLNSSHSQISYAVFCLKKKKKKNIIAI